MRKDAFSENELIDLFCFRMSKSDTASAVEKTLPNLLVRTGDTAARTRDQAKSFILEESAFPEVKVGTRSRLVQGQIKVSTRSNQPSMQMSTMSAEWDHN